MAKPTLTASIVGKEKANAAFKRLGKTQDFVAGVSGTSRQLVSKFLNGLSVEQPKFIAICEALELRWQEIAELDEVEVTNDSNPKELELLVQEVKQKIAADVTERCGTMRVLDMTQPVDLDRIYTDVNILKNLTRLRRIGYDEVKKFNTRENVNRFQHGDTEKRVTGFEAVEEFQKLVVLGKPGAGKTTFMKYLAMSCLGKRFHGELVPIFVTLKAYAEERGQPSLESYILTEFQKREVSGDVVKRLLKEGRALILLDGLDEVKLEDDRRVKQDIDRFSLDWLKNRFAITCRVAARKYQFEKFTEVEVADFDDDQIESFVGRWFREKDQSKVAILLEKLKHNQPVKELAENPLLLTLLCLVFGERNDFPPKRSELYKEGLEVLMKKWDAKRNIEREMIYKHLSPQNKEDMLGQIAFNTFVNSEYFFRQEDLQRQIKDYICNLPEATADPEALRLDSEVVLKAIEHHHGLLVERARNIYSFSHLTFQEYFAAKAIERGQQLEILVQNISNPRWKEVFYLTAEMLWRSDVCVKMMKDRIDGMLAGDEKLQAFLEWANHKTNSVEFRYKTVAVRAFYAYVEARARDEIIFRDRDISINYARNNAKNLVSTIDQEFFLSLEPDLFIDYCLALDHPITLNPDPNQIDGREIAHERSLDTNTEDIDLQLAKVRLEEIVQDLNNAIKTTPQIGENELQQVLKVLVSRLPNVQEEEAISQWWKNSRKQWMDNFYISRIDLRNMGHDWKFTKDQVELLKEYYSANLLLVECMNRSYVSKQVREEIEATMLLPSKK